MQVGSGLRQAALGAVLTAGLSAGAEAAGRFCGDPVESGLSSGATQEEALTAAVQWWSSRAGSLGRGYERWDNADDQALECSQDGDGTFRCKASGRPCLPAGTLPENVPKLDM